MLLVIQIKKPIVGNYGIQNNYESMPFVRLNGVVSAHRGMHKTIERLRRNLFWPGLSKEVWDYIRKRVTKFVTRQEFFLTKY